MLQEEKELRAKEKVLSDIKKLPQFTHKFFVENESISFTTKRGYCGILYHFLCFIKDLYNIKDVLGISPTIIENLELKNIKQYQSDLLNEFSISTVNSKINSLKGIFKYLYYNQIINKNVMSQVIIDNQKENKGQIDKSEVIHLLDSVSHISNDFLRIRNLCIVSIIIDTGLSVQDIVELDLSNIIDDKIVYENNNNIIQYILTQETIEYLHNYMSIINMNNRNYPLFISIQNDRISDTVVQNIFKKHAHKLTASDLQAKPTIKIKDTYNYTLTITPRVLRHKNKNLLP